MYKRQAGEDVWYLEANGDVHPCLIFQLESGKTALQHNIYKKETINVTSTKIESVRDSQYWDTFIQAKHRFKTEKIPTCNGCQYINECQPCFLDYGTYSVPVLECEWTKRKEQILFDAISDEMCIRDSIWTVSVLKDLLQVREMKFLEL